MPHPTKVRIVSDGSSRHTRIYDATTGEDLTTALMLRRIEIDVDDHVVVATLYALMPVLDVVAVAHIEEAPS